MTEKIDIASFSEGRPPLFKPVTGGAAQATLPRADDAAIALLGDDVAALGILAAGAPETD